jgi:hypothetical protein
LESEVIDLAQIEISRTDFIDPRDDLAGHTEVSAHWVIDRSDPATSAGHAPESVRAAASWAAGVLARIAIAAQPLVEVERGAHDCRSSLVEIGGRSRVEHGCAVGSFALAPSETPHDQPSVWIQVPTNKANEWIKRVGGWLREIDEAA